MVTPLVGLENVGILRNIYHFVLAPLILFFYGCVAFYALMEVAIRGKQVCKHGASKKEALEEQIAKHETQVLSNDSSTNDKSP